MTKRQIGDFAVFAHYSSGWHCSTGWLQYWAIRHATGYPKIGQIVPSLAGQVPANVYDRSNPFSLRSPHLRGTGVVLSERLREASTSIGLAS
jgi:hypothetical protein